MNFLPISVAVAIILSILFAASRRAKPIKTTDGGYFLQYATSIKAFGIGLIVLIIGGLTYVSLNTPIKDNGDLVAAVFTFVIFLIIALYFYVEFFTVKIWVGPFGIRGTSGWLGKREYQWHEIKKITYSPVFRWFIVSSSNKNQLRVSAMITGVDKFQEIFKEHLPKLIWISAQQKYDKDKRFKK